MKMFPSKVFYSRFPTNCSKSVLRKSTFSKEHYHQLNPLFGQLTFSLRLQKIAYIFKHFSKDYLYLLR